MLQTEKAMLDIQIDHRNNDQGSSAVHTSTHNETRRPIPDHARTAGLGHNGLSQNDYGRRHTKMRIPGVLKRNRFSAGSWFGITPADKKHVNPCDRGILASSRSCRDNDWLSPSVVVAIGGGGHKTRRFRNGPRKK